MSWAELKQLLALASYFYVIFGGTLLGFTLRKFESDTSFLAFFWLMLVIFIVLVSSTTLAIIIRY